MSKNRRLTKAETLTIAFTTLATFNTYVQQAESKVAIVITVHLGTAALAATQSSGLARAWAAGAPAAAAAVVLLLSFGAGFLAAGCHMVLALRPDLRGPTGYNRFGLVRAARLRTLPPAGVEAQVEEIHSLIEVLTAVAMHKHRHVRRALPWMALTVVSVILWTVVSTVNP